jgi:hypothetical protein
MLFSTKSKTHRLHERIFDGEHFNKQKNNSYFAALFLYP